VMPLNASHSAPFFVRQDPVRFRMQLASLKNSQSPKLQGRRSSITHLCVAQQ
jgi:hypothetical protein